MVELVPVFLTDGRAFHLDAVGDEIPLAFFRAFGEGLDTATAPAHAAKEGIALVFRLELDDLVGQQPPRLLLVS